MSSNSITIKHGNHRIYPCITDKKSELVNQIISQNSTLNILVVTSNNTKDIKDALEDKTILVKSDDELANEVELKCELLISYEIPKKATTYLSRVSHTTQKAVALVDLNEQKNLYPIETILGRTIKQEVIQGYEPQAIVEKKTAFTKSTKSQKKAQENEKKEFKKPNKWAKKDKKPNKFLGKDENGKAIFSGKSGDRNHRYDGTPKKTGRTINISKRALKKKEKD